MLQVRKNKIPLRKWPLVVLGALEGTLLSVQCLAVLRKCL